MILVKSQCDVWLIDYLLIHDAKDKILVFYTMAPSGTLLSK